MKLLFATSSENKFIEARAVFPDLVRFDVDLPEIQSSDQTEIAKAKLSAAIAQGLDRVLVEDTGLELGCLNGLPGPFIKFFLKRMGATGIFRLAETLQDRSATAVTIAACAIGGEILIARGEVAGELVAPRGESGFGFDPIFLPRGSTRTYADMTDEEKAQVSHRALAMRNLAIAIRQHP